MELGLVDPEDRPVFRIGWVPSEDDTDEGEMFSTVFLQDSPLDLVDFSTVLFMEGLA